MASNFITPIELQILDSSGIAAGTWTAFSAAGIEGALSYIHIINNSDTDIYISYDKVTKNRFIAKSGGEMEVYLQSNSTPSNYVSKLKKHTVVYAQGTAGTGNIYLSGFYNE